MAALFALRDNPPSDATLETFQNSWASALLTNSSVTDETKRELYEQCVQGVPAFKAWWDRYYILKAGRPDRSYNELRNQVEDCLAAMKTRAFLAGQAATLKRQMSGLVRSLRRWQDKTQIQTL